MFQLAQRVKYEIYLKVASFNQVLKEYIVSKEKNKEDLEQYRNQLLSLLDKLKRSDTLDYQVEGPLVEDIYKLTYAFIKEEIKVLDISPTLKALQNDEIHTYNLDKQIVKELETLDLQDKKYTPIVTHKNKIDAEGINAIYLEEKFISTIVKTTTSEKEIEKKVKELSKQASSYYKKAKELEKNIDKKRNYIAKRNKLTRMYLKRMYGNVALFATSLGTIVGLVAGSYILGEKIVNAISKKYTVSIDSYSSVDGELPTKEEIYDEAINTIQLKEYDPYELQENGYTRDILTFDLKNLEEMPLEDYLNVNLEALGITGESTQEYKNSLNLSDLYTETYSVVEKLETVKETTEYSKGWHITFFVLFLFSAYFIDLEIESSFLGISVERKNKDGEKKEYLIWGFIAALDQLVKNYEKLTKHKQAISKNEIELSALYITALNLCNENKELFATIEKLFPYIENNTSLTKDLEEAKEDLTRTLKIENKIFDGREFPNKK